VFPVEAQGSLRIDSGNQPICLACQASLDKMGQGACKACGTADPVTDTVKVNTTLLHESAGKPLQPPAEEPPPAEQLETEAEALRAQEHERQRFEAERRAQEEEELCRRQAQEQRRREEQARIREQQCLREEAELAERAAEEKAAAEAVARQVAEETRRLNELQAHEKAHTEAQEKVDVFLKARGFKGGISMPRKKCSGSSFPLHTAVQENSLDIVQALLLLGADKAAKNSGKKTPLEVATKLNKKGSHELIIAALT